MFGLENHNQAPLSPQRFFVRIVRHVILVLCLTALALFIGMSGYHYLEGLPWIDSFLNAAMILGGMGQVDPLRTEAGKLFAGSYALFAGLFFIFMTGIALTPIAHRVLHRFHIGRTLKGE